MLDVIRSMIGSKGKVSPRRVIITTLDKTIEFHVIGLTESELDELMGLIVGGDVTYRACLTEKATKLLEQLGNSPLGVTHRNKS